MGRGVRADRQSDLRKFAIETAARRLASSARTAPPTKRTICFQKFARAVLRTNNIDHHRTADFPALAAALSGKARHHCHHARSRQGSRYSADRQRSNGAASAAGVADPQQRSPEPREALHHQFRIDQAEAAGNQLHADPRRVSQTRSWPTLPAMTQLCRCRSAALRRRGSPARQAAGRTRPRDHLQDLKSLAKASRRL